MDTVFTVLVFLESVLGGDGFWWVYLQGCFYVVMVYRHMRHHLYLVSFIPCVLWG